jgi:glycine reductase
LSSIAKNVGANRIVTGAGIPHVVGNPDLDSTAEKALRRKLLERALRAVTTDAKTQQEF